MKQDKIKVYIKVDVENHVVDVNSSKYLTDNNGWIEIDDGYGDKYTHAHGNYLDKPFMDNNQCHNYKWTGSEVVGTTEEEKAAELESRPPAPLTKDQIMEQRIDDLSILVLQLGGALLA